MIFTEVLKSCWLTTLIGSILLTAGACVLFWNESRAINTTLSLDEAFNDAFTVSAEQLYDKSVEGKLIHLNGPIVTGEPLTEPDYNIQVQAVKLKRRVQMYQWIEEHVENNYGESVASVHTEDRTYYYTTDWRDELVDSRSFYIRSGHHNPTSFPLESMVYVSERVHIGQYELGDALKERFKTFVEITSDTRPEDPTVKLHSGLYYHCNDIWNPEIGDVRIQFAYAGLEGSMYTVVGKLESGKIVPYESSRSKKVLLIYPGELSLHDVFKLEHHAKRMLTWGWRLIGWIMLFLSATCSSAVLQYITSQSRMLRQFVPDPTFPVSTNLMMSFSLALAIISFAWIIHRPMLGGGILVAAVSPFLYCARSLFNNYQRMD
ncbi:transmembrane protein 43 homolog [Toxorhynchites rutilus septentrionalis]|uniref:transmembrane protein 43 homolog n=1 Tax=Toxorhynchites rutilus septentrionalis TaxID=329112 RepID=UPI00247B0655|nr:transmembrane protein 43 homolog [Toxorhynchites rutilus septentrionalis]